MPRRSILARLENMLRAIRAIEAGTRGKMYEQALRDDFFRFAVERGIEIISEASRHIPDDYKLRHPAIPWRSIKTTGNVIRHEYDRVEPRIIWDIVTSHLDDLRTAIEQLKSMELREHAVTIMSQSRIDRRFAALKKEGRAALVTFVTAGDPDLETSRKILLGLPEAGADIIELGMPFSDPMADGPAIQASSLRALKAGQTMLETLGLVRDFRSKDQETPIVLMGYYNPIYVYPGNRFLDDAASAGVDGLIVVDLPPEADEELCIPAMQRGLSFIRLATPTTDAKRLPAVLNNTSGFVYYVSITGITGTAAPDVNNVHTQVARIKSQTTLPVAVGFGVRTPEQAAAIARGADGVVVGSALVTAIEKSLGSKGQATGKTAPAVLDLVKSLAGAMRAQRSKAV